MTLDLDAQPGLRPGTTRTVATRKRCATGAIASNGKRDLRRSTQSCVTGHFYQVKLRLRLLYMVTATVSIITTIILLNQLALEIPRP